jgi:GTP-binding protein
MKINRELELYSEALMKKYMAVAATKTDAADPGQLDELSAYCRENGYRFYPISAVTGSGLDSLLNFLADRVEEEKEKSGPQSAIVG